MVLGVPAFLFYNWWSTKKDEPEQNISYKPVYTPNLFKEQQENKVIPDTSIASVSKQLTTPVGVSPTNVGIEKKSTPSPISSRGQTTVKEGIVSPVTQSPLPKKIQVVGETRSYHVVSSTPSHSTGDGTGLAAETFDIKNLPSESASMPENKQAFKSTLSTETVHKLVSYYAPKTSRDPTLSPDDYAKIEEQEQARLEYERQQRLLELQKERESNPIYKLTLQGIVGGAGGKNNAIINGEMLSEGNSIMGAKIVKIGVDYVIMEYKGKKYKRVLR